MKKNRTIFCKSGRVVIASQVSFSGQRVVGQLSSRLLRVHVARVVSVVPVVLVFFLLLLRRRFALIASLPLLPTRASRPYTGCRGCMRAGVGVGAGWGGGVGGGGVGGAQIRHCLQFGAAAGGSVAASSSRRPSWLVSASTLNSSSYRRIVCVCYFWPSRANEAGTKGQGQTQYSS